MNAPQAPALTLAFTLACSLAAGFVPGVAHAGLPLPDHLLHGTIVIGNQPVSRADTEVVVEARRSPGAQPVATYRMGTRPRLGNHLYELRLELEEAPVASPRAFAVGDSVHITVRNRLGIQFQTVHQITDFGVAQRLDFGNPVDSRDVGAPDAWQLANFGTLPSTLDLDSDGDGSSDLAEFVAGTHPIDAEDTLRLALQTDENGVLVTFRALAAEGPGYAGRQRYYALESAPDPAQGPWTVIPDHSRIPGDNGFLLYRQPADPPQPLFYRVRVWLE